MELEVKEMRDKREFEWAGIAFGLQYRSDICGWSTRL
jgi:hypothetical protein